MFTALYAQSFHVYATNMLKLQEQQLDNVITMFTVSYGVSKLLFVLCL